MTRRERNELERSLAQAFKRALEPTDPATRERLAQLIEDLEFKLRASLRSAAQPSVFAGLHASPPHAPRALAGQPTTTRV